MPRFCTNCGNQLTEAVKFCNKCGTPIGGIHSHPPAPPTQVTPMAAPPTQVVRPDAPATQVYRPETPAGEENWQGAGHAAPATQIYPPSSPPTQPQHAAPTTPQYEGNYQAPPPQTPPAYAQPPYQQPSYQAPAAGSGLQPNVAGLLCYITFIPALVFLLLEPYNRNRFVRFHAFQCLFLTLVLFLFNIALAIALAIAGVILPWQLISLVWAVVRLGSLALVILLMVKAYNNETYKLPVIGDMAEQQAQR
ncbi:MAG TPA: zinc-ribbon domain-containing protein [Blastocatellia bacterium]|nr:zinc-ribbon domain-containing protein [Blastocatellia bacterium]